MGLESKEFAKRHIGLKDAEIKHILHDLGYESMEDFLSSLIPDSIYDLSLIHI